MGSLVLTLDPTRPGPTMRLVLGALLTAALSNNMAAVSGECSKEVPRPLSVAAPSKDELDALITLTHGGHLTSLEWLELYDDTPLSAIPPKDLALLLSMAQGFELHTDLTSEQWMELAVTGNWEEWAPRDMSLENMSAMEGVWKNMTSILTIIANTEKVWLSEPYLKALSAGSIGLVKPSKCQWLEVWYGKDQMEGGSAEMANEAIIGIGRKVMNGEPRVARKDTSEDGGVIRLVV